MLQILWLQDLPPQLKTKNGSKLKQKVEKTFQNYLFVVSFCRLTQRKEKKRKKRKNIKNLQNSCKRHKMLHKKLKTR